MTATAVAPDSTARLYHFGLDESCPVDVVTAGGVALVKKTQKVTFSRHNTTVRTERLGDVAKFTPAEADRVREAVGRLAIRTVSAVDPKTQKVSTVSTVVRVGLKKELVRYKIDVDQATGLQTRTPIFESRRLKEFDKSTDTPLGPWVYFDAVEADPRETVPADRMPVPEWAQPPAPAPAAKPAAKK